MLVVKTGIEVLRQKSKDFKVSSHKGEETPRRGTPVLAYRVPMDKAGLLVEGGGGARVIADQLLILGF